MELADDALFIDMHANIVSHAFKGERGRKTGVAGLR